VISRDYNKASLEANKIAELVKKNKNGQTIILGPTTASQFRLNNYYRFQIIIKYKKDELLINYLKKLDEMYINNKDVYLEIDVDPNRL
jgi:primosomal protein N' (replication factor Y)